MNRPPAESAEGGSRSTLAAHLVGFSRLLKVAGFDVTSGRVIDAGRALTLIDISRRDDVRQTLKACFASSLEQASLFDRLFDSYWSELLADATDAPVGPELPSAETRSGRTELGFGAPAPEPSVTAEENPAETYSAVDLLTTKDFSSYTSADVRQAGRIVRSLAPRLAAALSRRRRPAGSRGPVEDLRRSLRRSVRYGGEVIELLHHKRRLRRLRLAVLCDVSGSMDVYSRFLLQLLFVFQNELRGVSTFVFSTRLNEVSQLLKSRSFESALAEIGDRVDAWSGGTSIGDSLLAFDLGYSRRIVGPRTVLIIISDGWDRGDTSRLVSAMQSFHRRARCVIWLNPLLGHAGYRPLAKGMAAALPHVDYFLPLHNLESLGRLSRTLVRVAGR